MENALCFHNATVVTGYSLMENGCVYVKDGKIEDVFSERRFLNKRFSPEVRIVDVGKAYIAPGLIDTHIHGFAGFGTEDCSPDSILGMSKALAEYGVTAFNPTLYPTEPENMTECIRAVVDAMGHEEGATIMGLHLEGPFISPEKPGALSPSAISPVNLDLMDKLWAASNGNIVNMTVAPELKNMRELALYCIKKNIVLQAGHTNALYENMLEGI